jgi:hypothetical protein
VVTLWGDAEDAIRKSPIAMDLASIFKPQHSVFISGMTANPVRNVTFRASFLITAYTVVAPPVVVAPAAAA